jgi:hypothetical protein
MCPGLVYACAHFKSGPAEASVFIALRKEQNLHYHPAIVRSSIVLAQGMQAGIIRYPHDRGIEAE